MDAYTRICGGCRREVRVSEATIENKVYFHDSCYDAMQGKRLKLLQRKCDNGQITAQEMKEFGELEALILKRQEEETQNTNNPAPKQKIDGKMLKDWMVTKPDLRETCLRSNSDVAFKRLEASRSERWAWEAMAMLETQLMLSWKEQFQLTDGK